MIRGGVVVCLVSVLGCSSSLTSNPDGAAGDGAAGGGAIGDGSSDSGDGAGVASTSLQGRVLVVQQAGASPPTLWTRAWFDWANPCDHPPSLSLSCMCTETQEGSCSTRSCVGRWFYLGPDGHPQLGYGPEDGPPTTGGPFEAGVLSVGNGASIFAHGAPYDAKDALAAPWQAGDEIDISALGADAPPFSVQLPFPPSVEFLAPDLSKKTLVFDSDLVDIKWTPGTGTGNVEATIAGLNAPDAGFTFVVRTCSAPVGQGEMQVAVPSGPTWRGLAVRVVNRKTVQLPGLTLDALVASFDSGPLDEAGTTPP